MLRKLAIMLALGNAALAAFLAYAWMNRPAPGLASEIQVENASGPGPKGEVESSKAKPSVPPAQDIVPKGLNWRLLGLADLHPCVANLREVGCPQATIQDIIVAEVNRRFAPRERALKLRYEDFDLWDAPPASTRNVLDSNLQLATLFAEKKALLKDLLGVDVDLPVPKALIDRTGLEEALASVPEAKRAQVKSIQQNYQAEIQKLRASTLNFMEPADVDALVKLKTERRKALAQALSTEELLEFDLKTSSLASTVKSSLGPDATEAEFRAAFKAVQGKYDAVADSKEAADQTLLMASMTQMRNDLRTGDAFKDIFSEERANELRMGRDPTYRHYRQAGIDHGLPREIVDKAYALQMKIQQEMSAQMADPNLSSQERMKIARKYAERIGVEMREALGDETFQKLSKQPRPPVQPPIMRTQPVVIQP